MLLMEVPRAARAAFRNLGSDSPLARLSGIAQTRRWLDKLESEYVEGARKAGLGWDEIAGALGVSAREARRRGAGSPESEQRSG